MPKVVIVGAGISGLALAFRLQQLARDIDLTILEQRNRPGGTIWTEHRDGFVVEIGPNGFLDTKPSTLALSQDLGLGEQLRAASESSGKNRYLFLDGKLQAPPNTLASILRSPLLSWRGKLGLLSEPFRRARRDTEDESIDAFARRRAGPEAANVLADAFVTGIHAGDPTLLSAGAAFPRLVEFENRYGSVIRGMTETARQKRAEAAARGESYRGPGTTWSFHQGLRLLVETLEKKLARPPLYGVNVLRLEERPTTGSPWQIVGEGQDLWSADALVLTCPSYAQAQMLGELDSHLAEQIAGIVYNRIAVIALGYRQEDVPLRLDGFGFVVPQRSRRDILGVQWCSSIYPDRAPSGHVLLRIMSGGWNRPEIVSWDDNRLLQAVQAELRLTMGITTPPVFRHIVRWERAIPQYHLGHLERVAGIETAAAAHPGLFLGGNAYRGIALNDCTEQAELLAGKIAAFIKAK